MAFTRLRIRAYLNGATHGVQNLPAMKTEGVDMSKRLILCDCSKSQAIDKPTLEAVPGLKCSPVFTALCTHQSDKARAEIAKGGAIIACQQERDYFEEIAEDENQPVAGFVDLRDRAGWGSEGENPAPKMAALVAESLLETPPVKMIDVHSSGQCLILGDEQVVLPIAEQLAQTLAVTALIETLETPPADRRFEVIAGRVRSLRGSLGDFKFRIDGFRQIEPGGRGDFRLTPARDGAVSSCDIVLDLRGESPLFPSPEKRNGYLRADPGDPRAVAAAAFEAAQLIGEFEKPLYIKTETHLCAHSRAGIAGCTKCLDICPTGAISPDGDHITIDPMICAGCSSCAVSCPSGAVHFDAPDSNFLFRRMQTLAETFAKTGGTDARLLVHDAEHGAQMISLGARYSSGLPANVIPLQMESIAGFGHTEMLAALASGFVAVDVLIAPRTEREALEREFALAQAIAGSGPLRLLDVASPDELCETLRASFSSTNTGTPVLPLGSRRQITRLVAKSMHGDTKTPLPLPETAPYGRVVIDTDACTLCLSCAALCPSGALADNPEKPQLRFQEEACLQCGLCSRVCPENAITLEARLDLSDKALEQHILHEEEPFECIRCGKPFGVRSAIEKISAKLAGKHEMFSQPGTADLIKMCDDCRVQAQFHSENSPLNSGERPRTKTTEDYLSKRRDH